MQPEAPHSRMMNRLKWPVCFAICLGLAHASKKVEEVYRVNCLSCHGANLDEGSGGSLVDGHWKHGGTDADLMRAIEKGFPQLGMEAYGSTLSEEEIRALVIYIREKEAAWQSAESPPPQPRVGQRVVTDRATYKVEPVAQGLNIPWSIDFLPDGRYIVTERPGTVRIIEKDGTLGEPIQNLPSAVHHGQGGMMAVSVHPDFPNNGWVYLGFTDGSRGTDRPNVLTKIVRGRIVENQWTDEQTIWSGDKSFYSSSGVHFGTRILFRDGYVFFGIGDRGDKDAAQDLGKPNGKIFRLHDDGRIPSDNPFAKTPGALPEIWSYGHRNPQGMAFDPMTGDLYETEHGPRGGDEFNRILPGRNYGWPVITYGMNYNGTPITALTEKKGMEQPLVQWTPSIAACGLDATAKPAFPDWKGDFFAGGLAAKEVRRLRVRNGKVTEQEVIAQGLGRVRDVRFGPAGRLYLVLNDPGMIVRLVPAK